MKRELTTKRVMKQTTARTDYIGALIEDERRLVMVAVDHENPWESFRQMRRVMKRRNTGDAKISLYESQTPLEHSADVIELESRRRAG